MKVVVLGLGKYVEEIVKVVSPLASVVVVEKEEEKLKRFLTEEEIKNISVVKGSATDVELWKDFDINRIDVVISFLTEESTLYVAEILRKLFKFRNPILFVARESSENPKLKELEVETLSVPQILGILIKGYIKGHGLLRYPVGVGLGEGELAELRIPETSPLVGMKVSELRRKNLRIALIYREKEVILPKPTTKINAEDKLLLAGKPTEVELFVNTILEGTPTFPMKWGREARYCKVSPDNPELTYLKERLKVSLWREECENLQEEDTGITVFGKTSEGFFGRNYLKEAFLGLEIPSVFLRGSFPYENILVSANTDVLEDLLPNAVDVARLFNAKLYICYITRIESMMTEEEKDTLRYLTDFVKKGKKLGKIEINLVRREGNPVRETLKVLREGFNLLVLGYAVGRTGSLFNPYTPYLLAKKSPITTLLIPEENP